MTSLDPENPATLSHTIVTEILREEMGFDGVVCTDDLTMGAISKTYGIGEAAVRAVAAGCDLLLICHEAENLKTAYDALCAAVESGSSIQQKYPFVCKAIKKCQEEALEAMAAVIDEETAKIMK